MKQSDEFDAAAAHRHFSCECFDQAWGYIDKRGRSEEESLQMLMVGMASLWHWTQRSDCTAQNLSVGYWQVSRIFALLGQADLARRFAAGCLQHSGGLEPFYRGYAYEALARAEALAGHRDSASAHLQQARQQAAEVADASERTMLASDLASLGVDLGQPEESETLVVSAEPEPPDMDGG